jgi:hypothetical protein
MVMLILMALAALMITPAMAADVTIPVNKDYTSDTNMVIHLIAVNITSYTMGNEFTKYGADNTIWPKILFTYTNKGNSADYGHLLIKFKDDQGNLYERTDVSMNMIQPGATSEMRFLEVPVQKDRKIAGFEIDEGFKTTYYPIEYQTTSTTTPGQGIPIISNLPLSNLCCTSLLLPLLAIGAIFVNKKKH